MRSKNLLPMQVVMPSNLMGSSQSVQKAAFEEALHSSIETSLRSPAVTPSSVFSTLFINLRPSSAIISEIEDIKPNATELNKEINKQNVSNQLPQTASSKDNIQSDSPHNKGSLLPLLIPSSQLMPTNATSQPLNSSMGSAPPRQHLSIPEQHQLEQIKQARVEQFKQLQRLHAWQQMQKSRTMPSQTLPPAIAVGSPSSLTNTRPSLSSAPFNGLHSNGNSRMQRSSIDIRDRQHTMPLSISGLCKSGKDIRLSTLEHDCSYMFPFPTEFVLLTIQTSLSAAESLIVIAINLKSLPPMNSSSQALSVQCVGCGEKSLHTFTQLMEHVVLEPPIDVKSSRLNSSQLLAPHARFYLIRDPKSPRRLLRGPPVVWNKPEERGRPGIPIPRFGNPPQAPLFRGNSPSTSTHMPSMRQPNIHDPHFAPGRLRGPIPQSPLGSSHLMGKRHRVSTDEVVVIPDEQPPKRYHLSAQHAEEIQIPEDLGLKLNRKPVIAMLCPPTNSLPHFQGDVGSIFATTHFSKCFTEPSPHGKTELGLNENFAVPRDLLLLVTVQYLLTLGNDSTFNGHDLSHAVLLAKQQYLRNPSIFKEIKLKGILPMLKLIEVSSNGQVEININNKSVCNGISECLKNLFFTKAIYQVTIFIPENINEQVHFQLVISESSNCRQIYEDLLTSRDQILSIDQDLLSLNFTRLRLTLAATSKNIKMPAITDHQYTTKSPKLSSECPLLQKYQNDVIVDLMTKVSSIYNMDNDISTFNSMRFIFLIPPSPALISQTVNQIEISGLLPDLYKTHLPVSSLSSQVVVTMETASTQRLMSMCKQWEDSNTLLVLVQLNAHSNMNSLEASRYLNDDSVRNCRNILLIQCSTFPYSLLTNHSQISTENCSFITNASNPTSVSPLYQGTATTCNTSNCILYDPVYENYKTNLLRQNTSLHTSLIVNEIVAQQYVTSLILSCASGQYKTVLEKKFQEIISPVVLKMMEDLIQSSYREGVMIIIRINSPRLASRFYDAITQIQEELNLQQTFEVILYGDSHSEISLSDYFQQLLQAKNGEDWYPTTLSQLHSIPCLIIYEGEDIIAQDMPGSLRYVDLRMSLDGCGNFYRSKIEQEIALATSTCIRGQSCSLKAEKHLDDESSLTVVESDDEEKSMKVENTEDERIWSKKEDSGNRTMSQQRDFLSMAMQEANLTAADKGSPQSKESSYEHNTPTAIVPLSVYDLLKTDSNGKNGMTNIDPDPRVSWMEPLHPRLNTDDLQDSTLYYKKWTTTTLDNPDHQVHQVSNTTHDRRILLVHPPNLNTANVCCQFLQRLHRKLQRMMEVEIYNDEADIDLYQDSSVLMLQLDYPNRRSRSQIVNLYPESVLTAIKTDPSNRKVTTRVAQKNDITTVRNSPQSQEDLSTVKRAELRNVSCLNSEHRELAFQLIVPRKYEDRCVFEEGSDGTLLITNLKLSAQTDRSIRSTIVSFGMHGIKHGLYNFTKTLDSSSALHNTPLHLVVIKQRDLREFEGALVLSHLLIVLPKEFDDFGKGAMKYAAQAILNHFYECETQTQEDMVWPFVLFVDDDCVSWSMWNNSMDYNQNETTDSWNEISLFNVMENLESSIDNDMAVVGFKPWTSQPSQPTSEFLTNRLTREDNYFSNRLSESCYFVNLSLVDKIKFTHNRFIDEDIDWSLRVASSGLQVIRMENICVATKAIEDSKMDEIPKHSNKLVVRADSDFSPLSFHPCLLLEHYFSYNAEMVFPRSKLAPTHPVLCLDHYISYGTEICVEYVSSQSNAVDWSTDTSKLYGGLMLYCPSSNVKPDFLQTFQFVEDATVCVIGTDRSSLRHTIIKLNLEVTWHFRLTDEFQTANLNTLDGAKVRPMYFLTGIKKK